MGAFSLVVSEREGTAFSVAHGCWGEVRKQEEVWRGPVMSPVAASTQLSELAQGWSRLAWDAELESFWFVCLFVFLLPSRCYRYMKFSQRGGECGVLFILFFCFKVSRIGLLFILALWHCFGLCSGSSELVLGLRVCAVGELLMGLGVRSQAH